MQRFTLSVRCYFAHFFRRLWFVVDRRVFRSVRAYQRNSTFIHIPLLSLFSFDDFPCCFDYERDVVWNSNRLSIMCNHCHSSYENVTELRFHWNRREQWSYNELQWVFVDFCRFFSVYDPPSYTLSTDMTWFDSVELCACS